MTTNYKAVHCCDFRDIFHSAFPIYSEIRKRGKDKQLQRQLSSYRNRFDKTKKCRVVTDIQSIKNDILEGQYGESDEQISVAQLCFYSLTGIKIWK